MPLYKCEKPHHVCRGSSFFETGFLCKNAVKEKKTVSYFNPHNSTFPQNGKNRVL